ncbi:MAG TPA: hypothetical protein VGO43_01425 [Pyrinomonadaceae bacterium]|jgi:hypothetical protein|nr:hypothetical protein [Pyrinomonadaceae bacterium]
MKKFLSTLAVTSLAIVILNLATPAQQRGDVTITLNEPFFDALLDAVFQNFGPPEFSIGGASRKTSKTTQGISFAPATPYCTETVKLLREAGGVRSAVRFRDGKVSVPIAFSGEHAPPFIGCVEFAGTAEANVDLEFDRENQRLIGRVHVVNVNLNGSGGIGGVLIAKMLQSSVDKKLNPLEILRLDKISFVAPVPNSGNLRMKAIAVKPTVENGSLRVDITYEFAKN